MSAPLSKNCLHINFIIHPVYINIQLFLFFRIQYSFDNDLWISFSLFFSIVIIICDILFNNLCFGKICANIYSSITIFIQIIIDSIIIMPILNGVNNHYAHILRRIR